MILLQPTDQRDARANYLLGGSTAIVAGLVNVCSVMAFFAFSSNATGHVANFAEEIVKGHWHQVSVAAGWLLAFLLGAFVANNLVTRVGPTNVMVGHATPVILQLLAIAGAAYYGHHHYLETLRETECLVGALLFSMGLQNGAVSSVSNTVVRTTHLTGLFTDLGMELSMVLQDRHRRNATLLFKLRLHLLILAGYIAGGLLGGVLYLTIGLQALYVASALLLAVLAHDVILVGLTRDESLEHSR